MISAVVPVWNGREHLARLLDSLDAQTLKAGEVLAIDNGSTDGAPDLAQARGGGVIAMGRNAGFAAAVNRGVRAAKGEWIAVLNTDVVLAPDYFERLMAAGAPFATGKIVSTGGLLDATFDVTSRGATTWRAGSGMRDGAPFDTAREIGSAPFTAVLLRAEVFQRVGLLEERFESYLEDADFGLRCAMHGIVGRYVPQARAVHVGSASLGTWSAEKVRLIARNQLLLASRHFSRRRWWNVAVAQLLWGAVAVRHGAGGAWLRGKLEGLRGFGLCAKEAGLLDQTLRANEQFLHSTSRDGYWRLYFLLTGGAK